MSSAANSPEISKTLELAKLLRSQGYEVLVEPGPDRLPKFLQSFRPDIVATKDGRGLVVEVKQRGSSRPAGLETARLAQAIEAEPDWEFQLVIADPPIEKDWPEENARTIARHLDEAEQLDREGAHAAATMVAWASLEASMRLALGKRNQTIPALALISECVHVGMLSDEESKLLRTVAERRNRAAHGFAAAKLTDQMLSRVLELGRRLLNRKVETAA